MDSIILCYAPADEVFARHLASNIEINLPLSVSCNEAVVGPKLDLIEATELALSAEAALVILSPQSVPKVWNRKTWEPVFFDKPKQFQTLLGFVLLSGCVYPTLLRRERFFDASVDAEAAVREVKRWLLRPLGPAGPAAPVSPEFEEIRRTVSDRPGTAAGIPAALAVQFAEECARDFEAVYRFDCRDRSRAGITGDIGAALGLRMSGSAEENRAALSEWCSGHRVLFVLAGVSADDLNFAAPGGRTSLIFTAPADSELPGSISGAAAEAVRSFQTALRANIEAGLSLGWKAVSLLKAQERFVEVLEVLDAMAKGARDRGDPGHLLRIERELSWMRDYDGGLTPRPIPAPDEQLKLPFF